MLYNTIYILLLILAGAVLHSFGTYLVRQFTGKSSQNLNDLAPPRAASHVAKTGFRGQFRDVAVPPAPLAQPHPPERKRALRARHLATLGYSYAPEPRLLQGAYRRLAAKWDPNRFNTANYTDAQRAKAAENLARITAAYAWLRGN